ncbi:Yip1-domain-containing protein [Setomelanomma holmii]|uniref:Protein YIP n=1 Tax=Setomelanomma holmii TaxID=210430 RepID=A0A9P4HHD7_9PLEO|nr:Yip1-domain-containing protein [Setomelanomma holmii]
MAAMMPSASTSSGNPYDDDAVERDLIDPDDATLDDLDDPLQGTSDRAPLTGNISARSGAANTQSYLTSSIPGEDRRAPTNTIDETVWETLSRDLLAIWEKMKQVLYPKYLLGGMMQQGGGIGAAERGDADGLGGSIRNIAGRWPDADALLQSGMSEGLRDWDLWGPLIFCLLLSLFLSWGAGGKQKDLVFSGVFAMVWIGEAVVTLQIKLLGGNMCVQSQARTAKMLTLLSAFFQSISIIGYTLFPLVIAALLSAIGIPIIVRVPVYLVLIAWSLAAGVSIMGGSGVVRNRVGIAVYPLFVFYIALGCLCFIS